jgi:murein DD-endopeptidase MepM/ murein hydrolase activator NlpD
MNQKHRILTYIYILFLIVLFGNTGLESQGDVHKRQESDKDSVDRQHADDLNRIEKIKKELREFMDDINKRLGTDNKTRIDDPVDIDNIDDINKIDHYHSRKKILSRKFAFVNGERVPLRSEGTTESAIIGYLDYREQVELITQTERNDTIKEVIAPWFLVRRSNGDEGWVFGAFLQKALPDKKEDSNTFDKEKSYKEFSVPVTGKITSRYGYRVHPVTKRRESFHKGIDIAAKEGNPVKASADGIVVKAEYCRNGYGNLVIIEHEKELTTYYGHLSEIRVKSGQRVSRAQVIGAVGSTGNATGAHLHFEVRRGGTAYDPEAFLR